MISYSLLLGVPVVALGAALIAYVFVLRSRFRYTSSLSCPKCQKPFNYDWIPGVSFNSLKLGKGKSLECPRCHEWSTFNILDTRKDGKEDHPAIADVADPR